LGKSTIVLDTQVNEEIDEAIVHVDDGLQCVFCCIIGNQDIELLSQFNLDCLDQNADNASV